MIIDILKQRKKNANPTLDNLNKEQNQTISCKKCNQELHIELLKKNDWLCPFCGYHFPMNPRDRINSLLDPGSFVEYNKTLTSRNPISFPGYIEKYQKAQEQTGEVDAVVTGEGCINNHPVVICVMNSFFMMGSMGSVVGEKITLAIEKATEKELPLIIFTASGGARMQEGIVSLMQMAKTSAALKRFSDKGLLYITVLTHPTTGGVSASFAMLGDIILGEPEALVGFAGRRVIEQTIRQKLPDTFQKTEFLLEKGFVDNIIPRKNLKKALTNILSIHEFNEIKNISSTTSPELELRRDLTPWQKVKIARHNERPKTKDYIDLLVNDFLELHGDRLYQDDPSIIGGIGKINNIPVTVIGHQKGNNTKENIKRNFGMPHPEGYRKALRLMKDAEKFQRPIILFIDTPGAYCGMEAEERGQSEAIATNLLEMSGLKTPILIFVIGEGGSGGALALGVGDHISMLEHAVYSVISPEGLASILWKDASLTEKAANQMKLTAEDLLSLNVIDNIIEEPAEGAHEDIAKVTREIKGTILSQLNYLSKLDTPTLLQNRYQKLRSIGSF